VRTAYGPVGLGTLASGESRALEDRELADLYAAIDLPWSLTSSR
jgi:16S rRNA U516 pseudouridylate synthase RsuA-like enzyme